MKKLIILLIVFVFISGKCYADEYSEILESYTKSYAEKIEENLDSSSYLKNSFPDFEAEKIMLNVVNGKELFSFKNILNKVFDFVLYEIKVTAKSLVYLIVISILGSFLFNLRNLTDSTDVASVGYLLIYLLTVGVLTTVFSELSSVVLETVRNLSLFLKGIFPVILASLYASGCITSSTVLQPILSAAVQVGVHIIEKILIPFVMLSFSVCIVSCLSEKINADKFSGFLMKSVKWVLTTMLIVFIGMIGLQSIASASVDGLSVKLTKFATSNLVPIVGGILSESVETVMNCGIVIKNSVGICGILAVIYISLMPVLKIGINLIVLRFSAAVMQPISDARIIKCITNTADIVSMLLAIVASTSVMFILIITIIINTGNSVIMLGR